MEVNMQTVHKHIIVPQQLVKQIEDYQKQQGIISWTSAILELARKGLEASK